MPLALRVQNLWKSYTAGVRGCSARIWVLRGCTIEVAAGERVGIVGARGAGKSTLLRCLAGERSDAGRVETFGESVLLADEEATVPAVYRGASEGKRAAGTLVLVSRDVARVRQLVDRVYLLRDGRLALLTQVVVRRVAERARG